MSGDAQRRGVLVGKAAARIAGHGDERATGSGVRRATGLLCRFVRFGVNAHTNGGSAWARSPHPMELRSSTRIGALGNRSFSATAGHFQPTIGDTQMLFFLQHGYRVI